MCACADVISVIYSFVFHCFLYSSIFCITPWLCYALPHDSLTAVSFRSILLASSESKGSPSPSDTQSRSSCPNFTVSLLEHLHKAKLRNTSCYIKAEWKHKTSTSTNSNYQHQRSTAATKTKCACLFHWPLNPDPQVLARPYGNVVPSFGIWNFGKPPKCFVLSCLPFEKIISR